MQNISFGTVTESKSKEIYLKGLLMKQTRFSVWTEEKSRDILTLSSLYHGSEGKGDKK